MIQSSCRRTFAWLLAAAVLAVSTVGLAAAQDASPSRAVTVDIRMPLDSSSVEVALSHGGRRYLPAQRLFTPQAEPNRPSPWLRSSPIDLAAAQGELRAVIRIVPPRPTESIRRYEFAVEYDGEILLPSIRYASGFYRQEFLGQWISSAPVTLPDDAEPEETGPGSGPDSETETGGTNTGEGEGGSGFAFTSTPSDQTFTAGTRIDPIVLPTATGGTGALRYDLIHRIRGLAFDRTTRALSGTPETPGEHLIFYTVSDAAGAVANTTFTINVSGGAPPSGPTAADPRPTFGDAEIAPQTWIVGNAINPLTLPEATGGNAPIRYDLDPSIPGIFFNRSSRTVSGEPTRLGNFTMRYSATDADGDGASILFPVQIAVAPDTSPTLPVVSLGRDYVVDVEQSDALPAGVGGNAPLSYALSPAIPGMTFNTGSRVLSGTPDRAGTYNMQYTVTDSDGDAYSVNFSISVVSSPSADTRPNFGGDILGDFLGLQVGEPAGFWILAARGGDPPLTYSLSGAPGFTVRPGGGRIEGTPTRSGTFPITLTVTDADGDSAVVNGRMFISPRSDDATPPPGNTGGGANAEPDGGTNTGTGGGTTRTNVDGPDLSPSFSSSLPNLSATVGVPMSAVLPAATGGNTPLEYAISAVPGLDFDTDTRTLSGTPASAGAREMLYIVYDADRDIDTRRFTLTISEASSSPTAVQPQLPTEQLSYEFAINEPQSITLPAATEGTGPLTYSLRGNVPGMEFDPATRIFAGTPTEAGTTWMSYKAAGTGTFEIAFPIRVVDATAPGPPDASPSFGVEDVRISGPAAIALRSTLPAANGGDGAITYSLSSGTDAAPATGVAGLRFDPSARVLAGTPPDAGEFSVRYTATDADGDDATIIVYVNVGEAQTTDSSPSFGSIAHSVTGTIDEALSSTFPAAAGGNGDLRYRIATRVPGLSFDPATRVLSGTPSTAGAYQVLYTVADADGDAALMAVSVTISSGDTAPRFSNRQGNITVRDGDSWSAILPAAIGGNGTLAYSLSTANPAIRFDAATRQISSTGDQIMGGSAISRSDSVTYRVIDGDSNRDSSDGDQVTFYLVTRRPQPAGVNTSPSFATGIAAAYNATAGEAFSATLPGASGGNAPVAYALERLPQGLEFNGSTRVLSGTPEAAGNHRIRYTATDSDGDRAAGAVIIRIASPDGRIVDQTPSFALQAYIVTGAVGQALSSALPAASGGDGGLTYTLSSQIPGLSLSRGLHTLSGTPTSARNFLMRYVATDEDGDSASMSLQVRIAEASAPTAAAPRLPTNIPNRDFTINTSQSITLPAAIAGGGPLTYSLQGDVRGMRFNAAARTFSGTPTQAGTTYMSYTVAGPGGSFAVTFPINVRDAATDRGPAFRLAEFSIDAAVGTPLSVTLPAASGGAGALTYRFETPPRGLRFNAATRVLSGTPEVSDAPNLTYTATDANGNIATMEVQFDIVGSQDDRAPRFASTTYQINGVRGASLSFTLPEATGGDGRLTYALTTPPRELRWTPVLRLLSGSVPAVGNYTMTYIVTDADDDTDRMTINLSITDTPVAGSPTWGSVSSYTCSGTVGRALSCTLPAASGGTGALSYTLARQPQGLFFTTSTRVLAGTPLAARTTSHAYTATDGDGDTATMIVSVRIAAAPAGSPAFRNAAYSIDATVGTPLSITLPAASGGTGALTYSFETPPRGLSFNAATRVLSGTPEVSDAPNLIYTATDSNGNTARMEIQFDIVGGQGQADRTPAFASTTHQINGVRGTSLSFTLPQATGGDGRLTYSLESQPRGLVFTASTRVLSGTPAAASNSTHTYTATDADGDRATMNVRIVISPDPAGNPTFSVTQYSIDGTVGTPLSTTLPAASGGTGALTYSLESPPRGLRFNAATRVLSGTPEVSGAPNLTYTATDSNGNTARIEIQFDIVGGQADRTPAFASTTHQISGVQGTSLSFTLPQATGGDGTLTYSLASPPRGLVFTASTRVLSGTPAAAGTSSLAYTATDSDGDTASITVSVQISAAAPEETPAVNAPTFSVESYTCSGTTGVAVSCTLPAGSGGDGRLTYWINTLPIGFTFHSGTRVLSGTSTVALTRAMTYDVADRDWDSDRITVTLTIAQADRTPSFSASSHTCYGTANSAVSCTLPAASGGDGALTYQLESPPRGLSFTAATRVLAGTPSASSNSTHTYTVTDADGDRATMNVRIVISPDPASNPTFSATEFSIDGTVGTPLSTTLPAASGGTGTLTYSLASPPRGLTLNSATRVLSGTPEVSGAPNLTYTATDSNGNTASIEIQFDIVDE